MPNQPIVTAGLVLRETVTRETDKILTVLTPDRGKISLIARGARRKNSRLAAACQLLAYSELTIYEKGQWFMLDEAETLELFTGLRTDFVALSLAGIDGAGIFAGRYFGEGWYGPSPFSFLRSSDVLRKRKLDNGRTRS